MFHGFKKIHQDMKIHQKKKKKHGLGHIVNMLKQAMLKKVLLAL
jgi:hypothetical protein